MELWIRSQDKDILLKVKSLLIDDNNNDIYTQDYIGNNLTTYTLGTYQTKERALEVLDEIQNILSQPKQHIENDVTYYMPNDGSSKIYEMPKD